MGQWDAIGHIWPISLQEEQIETQMSREQCDDKGEGCLLQAEEEASENHLCKALITVFWHPDASCLSRTSEHAQLMCCFLKTSKVANLEGRGKSFQSHS